MRPDPNAKPAVERAPNPERLSGKELMEDQFEHIAAINRDEDALAALRESISDARSDALSRTDLARADVELAAHANERSKNPSKKIEERCDKQRTTLTAERKAIEANFEKQFAVTPGSARNHLRDFFNSAAAYGDFVHAATPTDIREGESPMDANTRLIAEYRALLEEKRAVARAALPGAEVTAACYSFVAHLAEKAPLGPIIGGLRGVSYDEERGTFRRRLPHAPADAAGLVGLIAALIPDELAGVLAAQALQDHDEAAALDDVARREKLDAIAARLLEIQYSTEANHRYARNRGGLAGIRIASNPLAILDLKPA